MASLLWSVHHWSSPSTASATASTYCTVYLIGTGTVGRWEWCGEWSRSQLVRGSDWLALAVDSLIWVMPVGYCWFTKCAVQIEKSKSVLKLFDRAAVVVAITVTSCNELESWLLDLSYTSDIRSNVTMCSGIRIKLVSQLCWFQIHLHNRYSTAHPSAVSQIDSISVDRVQNQVVHFDFSVGRHAWHRLLLSTTSNILLAKTGKGETFRKISKTNTFLWKQICWSTH